MRHVALEKRGNLLLKGSFTGRPPAIQTSLALAPALSYSVTR
jgi:hypothetical protein